MRKRPSRIDDDKGLLEYEKLLLAGKVELVLPTPFPIYDENGNNINPGCKLDEKGRVILDDVELYFMDVYENVQRKKELKRKKKSNIVI